MKTIPIPIFKSEVKVARVADVQTFAKKYDFFVGEDYECMCGEMYPGTYLIIVSETARPASIVHECTHAANLVLGRIGHKFSYDNDEVQAYLLGYIFDKVWAEFVKV
jgi:hypothetical protein